jgi:hypothetical protein
MLGVPDVFKYVCVTLLQILKYFLSISEPFFRRLVQTFSRCMTSQRRTTYIVVVPPLESCYYAAQFSEGSIGNVR